MKTATQILHNIQPIIVEVEKVLEKIIEVIPIIEKDIASLEKIFNNTSIETDTVIEQEPVSSSSDDLVLELIYPDYDEEIDDIPQVYKPPTKTKSFKK